MFKVMTLFRLRYSALATVGILLLSGVAAHASVCSRAVSVDSDWEQVICPDSEFERTVTKTGSHRVGYSTPGCESGTSTSTGGTVPQPPESGGGTGGGYQSSGGGISSGGTTTLLGDDACPTLPPEEGYDEEKDCEVCVNSSVFMSLGAYQDSEVDLSVQTRPFPIVWDRYYRSNTFEGLSKPSSSYSSRCLDGVGEIYPATTLNSHVRPLFSPPRRTPLGSWSNIFLSTAYKTVYVHSYERYIGGECIDLTYEQKLVHYIDERGRLIKIPTGDDGKYKSNAKLGISVIDHGDYLEIRKKDGTSQFYTDDGRLLSIRNPLGKSVTLGYDEFGRLESVKDDAETVVLTFTYDGDGTLIRSVTDNLGRVVNYDYDGLDPQVQVDTDNGGRVTIYNSTTGSRLIGATNVAGRETRYEYNAYNGMTSKTNPLGETVTIKYTEENNGIVSEVINPVGTELMREGRDYSDHAKSFVLDFINRIYYYTDENGHQFKRVTDSKGRLVSETEMAGETTIRSVEYIDDERKEIHTDAVGNVKLIYKDEWENIKKIVDGEGNVTTFTWNSKNRPLTIKDPLGVETRFFYDSSGTLLTQKIEAVGLPEQVVTNYSYTSYGELETVAVDGATTSVSYNAQGQPTSITDQMGNVSRLEYDTYGNIAAAVDAEGNRTTFAYDDLGNPLTVTDPLGNETTMEYNAAGRLTQITDALDRTTKFETDYKERIIAVVNALDQRKEFDYDGAGNLVAITESDAVTLMTYDSSKRLTSVTDPVGNTTSYNYSAAGCSSCGGSSDLPEEVVDPFQNITKNLFDQNGQLKAVEDPLQNLTSVSRDALGRVTSQVDGNGNTTTFEYDALGRLVRQVDAEGGITSFAYNKRGNLIRLTDAESNTTQFQYDLAGRKIKEIRPMGQATEYSYFKNGLLKTVKDAKQQVSTYTYDAANRLTEITYADNTKDTFGYDAVGNLISYANPDVSGTLAYDKLNRKLSETVDYGSFQKSFSYTYDDRGNKATYTNPEALTHTYTYRKNDQLETINVDGKTFSFEYEKNRLKKLSFPNGVTTEYGYNANNWLANITTTGPLGPILTRDYSHDNVGNIKTKDSEHGIYNYEYDKTYQLTSADNPTIADEAYTYDKVGNRLSALETAGGWSYNDNNELLSDTRASFEYDANGNTVKKIESGQVTSYEYNARNRLSKVYLPDGRIATYTYDPFGRRIKKQVANTTTFFTYADEGLVAEYRDNGSEQKSYGWKPDVLWGANPVFQVDNGKFYYYHNDGDLFIPQSLTGNEGNVVWEGYDSSFGGLIALSEQTTVDNRLRFPGQYEDGESGLNFNWNRYYSATTGAYLSRDLMIIGGLINGIYLYSKNNPRQNHDVWGLAVGHHIVPRQVFKDLPDEVAKYFDKQTTGKIPGGHGWSKEHKAYNQEIMKLLDDFLKKNNICRKTIDVDHAKEFLELVKRSKNIKISNFLAAIAKKTGRVIGVAGTTVGIVDDLLVLQRANESGNSYAEQVEIEMSRMGPYVVVGGFLMPNIYYRGEMY